METWLSIKEVANLENVTERSVQKRAKKSKYPSSKIRQIKSEKGGGKSGMEYQIHISALSVPAQTEWAQQHKSEFLPALQLELSPQAALEISCQASKDGESKPESGLSEKVLKDERVRASAPIIQEAVNVPEGWTKGKWMLAVAEKHGISRPTLYRMIQRYEKGGLAGLQDARETKGKARAWDDEALEFWFGMVLKRQHRKLSRDALYEILQEEARKKDWKIGSYRSALWWLDQRLNPQLRALQTGGKRALDNSLPPVLRDYSDLQPFEILVGDQHRFDFWVVDDDTGDVFRPEGYFWQDLRTRCFYGGAVARRYDSHLMGVALRVGIRIYGAFKSIYTDHGRPEESKYIAGILKEMQCLGMSVKQTSDIASVKVNCGNPEEICCMVVIPGTHRKAIVRNAKAKMIEGTFRVFEQVLRDDMKVPGYVKKLGASQEENEIDQKEAAQLADAGKLLLFSEFVVKMFEAMDFYNHRSHRGVIREWVWKPKMKQASPRDCLSRCYEWGWRPTKLSEEAVNLVFLPKIERKVDRARIHMNCMLYESRDLETIKQLATLHRQPVTVRWDPMDPSWILCFHQGEFIGVLRTVQYSSMKNSDLATEKIRQKAKVRKHFIEEYRRLTSSIPDFREFSTVDQAEQTAARIATAKKKEDEEEKEFYSEVSSEEMAERLAKMEALQKLYEPKPMSEEEEQEAKRKIIEIYEERVRRVEEEVNKVHRITPKGLYTGKVPLFGSDFNRYKWWFNKMLEGYDLPENVLEFFSHYENQMDPETREYWAFRKEHHYKQMANYCH